MQSVSGVTGLPRPQVVQPSKPKIGSYLLLLLILALAIWGGSKLFGKEEKIEEKNEDEKVEVIDLTDEEDDDSKVVEEEDVTTDFSEFSTGRQSVGEDGNTNEYTLLGITDTSYTGFHRFVFEMSGKDGVTQQPNIIADYRASLGSIRVDLNGTTTDNSGIGYQKSRDVNKDGVIRLYHNVSSDQTEELYDIGVVSSTPFYLYVSETSTGVWKVTLDVKYPGASEVEVDSGSGDFSKDEQTISGGGSSDGARVTSYSYNTSSGVLSLVFTVTGSSSKPVPSALAKYEGDLLTLNFTSLVSDTIAKDGADVSLPGGIKMVAGMSGSSSTYTFEGASREFRLSATTSPNQVVLEIRL